MLPRWELHAADHYRLGRFSKVPESVSWHTQGNQGSER